MTAILSTQGLTKTYKGVRAMQDLSVDIERAVITSIIGPNGAGKSTLFNMVSGYVKPTAGRILFNGDDITGLATNRIAGMGIARAFQISKPFPDFTVERNVAVAAMFGRKGPRDQRQVTDEAISMCRLESQRHIAASKLSVGNLRRLELARAMAARPELLLADEPCAGLNETETIQITEVLQQICARGVSVVLVEHDIKAVRRVSQRVIAIEAGRRIADGTPDEVFSDRAVIDAYLGAPVT